MPKHPFTIVILFKESHDQLTAMGGVVDTVINCVITLNRAGITGASFIH